MSAWPPGVGRVIVRRRRAREVGNSRLRVADLPTSAVGALARLRDARMHAIGAEEAFRALKGGSHRDASWRFLTEMRDVGRGAADRWLKADLVSVGIRATMDLSGYAGAALDPIAAAPPLVVS